MGQSRRHRTISQGDGESSASQTPVKDTVAEECAQGAEDRAVEATPSRSEGDHAPQDQEHDPSNESTTTKSYFGSYLGSMKKYTGQVCTPAMRGVDPKHAFGCTQVLSTPLGIHTRGCVRESNRSHTPRPQGAESIPSP